VRFYGTAACLGLSFSALSVYGYAWFALGQLHQALITFGPIAASCLLLATVAKLLSEVSIFLHLRDKQHGELKRSAILLAGELRQSTAARFVLGLFGGVMVPMATLHDLHTDNAALACVACALSFAALFGGELLERMSFFSALSSPRMPGGLR
jgi:hypothetical protein